VVDPGAVAVALGISIGRIGDLIIGDHLGRPTSWLLAWKYSGGTLAPPFTCGTEGCQASLQGGHLERISRSGATLYDSSGTILAQGVGVHQTALYDMILVGLLFGLLWYLQKRPRREGVLTLTFGLFYGCFRLVEDSLRIDKRFGPLTGSQWTALTVAVISAAILLWWRFHPLDPTPSDPAPRDPELGDLEPDPEERLRLSED
jgi:phosphatidylglycerol---prolipoprotein diacylglyceryl transferase